jgi:alpha-glucuronidase
MLYRNLLILLFLIFSGTISSAQVGYELWLQSRLPQGALDSQLSGVYAPINNPTIAIVVEEIQRFYYDTEGKNLPVLDRPGLRTLLVLPDSLLERYGFEKSPITESEGFIIRAAHYGAQEVMLLHAPSSQGLLYGIYDLIRLLNTGRQLGDIYVHEAPMIQRRILNHWDNLDRTIERGYAGFSLWDWPRLPGYIDPRYRDYARANASIGINGTVLTNVNANALILTPEWLKKAAALADTFRPYGLKVYLTARFSAPMEIGGLATADPLDEGVADWWQAKVKEIYQYIPDFGGFLVKANSEGQPGPQDYGRTHADGANLLAKALQEYGGIVMWRAFVYDNEVPEDRAKQAYSEFVPLDGMFEDNVIVQVKNGAIDFQPREPFHPLFGAMPNTQVMAELQITQEYLGMATNLAYLAPLFKECLDADTYRKGKGSTVARVVDGSLFGHQLSAIAGVSNIGNTLNWTGHPLAQANWYAFGRLAWNYGLSSEHIVHEWIVQTFGQDSLLEAQLSDIMLRSREAVVRYMTPMGLHHLMGWDHHYGPGPWIRDKPRADWTSVYYHHAGLDGIGFDRTRTGSSAVDQYAAPVADIFNDVTQCPEELLLWFHHLPWDYKLKNGDNLWDGLVKAYYRGVEDVRGMQEEWNSLEGCISPAVFQEVQQLMAIQLSDAILWRDACVLYFQQFSRRPIPAGLELPMHDLEYYENLEFKYVPGI